MGSTTLMLGSGCTYPQQLDAGASDTFIACPVNLFTVLKALTKK